MNTKILKVDLNNIDMDSLKEAGQLISEGELVAFPTETVYGLGGDALDAKAAEKIYKAKGRPSDNPLIVHISKFEELEMISKDLPIEARKLADRFWPGSKTNHSNFFFFR